MDAAQQERINQFAEKFGDRSGGTTYYLGAKGPDAGVMNFGTHFNPKLAHHSPYFNAMEGMMECVERNIAAENVDTVCKQEFKALRLAAFQDQLLYHQINQRHFMGELAFKRNESPY